MKHDEAAQIFRHPDTPMPPFLEPLDGKVVCSPDRQIDLLANIGEEHRPLRFSHIDGGLQIRPHTQHDPDWHIPFKGKVIRAGDPRIPADHEQRL